MSNRRHFLMGAATALAATATRRGWAEADQAKRDRVSVMTLDFNPIIKSPAHPDDPKRTLDILDYADMIAEHYSLHHVEFQHSHFTSTEAAYLQEVRDRIKKAKSQMNQINVEFGALNISATDPMVRLETIDLTKQWIDHAALLGLPARDDEPGHAGAGGAAGGHRHHGGDGGVRQAEEDRHHHGELRWRRRRGPRARRSAGTAGADGRRGSHAAASARGHVGRGGGSAQGGGRGYANCDIGNFPDEESRHAGERVMFKMSAGGAHCHYAPDRWDFDAAMAIPKEVGYKGTFSIEHSGPDPYAAVAPCWMRS